MTDPKKIRVQTGALVLVSVVLPVSGAVGKYLCEDFVCYRVAEDVSTTSPYPLGSGVGPGADTFHGSIVTTLSATTAST